MSRVFAIFPESAKRRYLCALMDKGKPNIRRLTQQELSDYFTEMGEKAFRARQVWDWLWVHHTVNFDEMTNLSRDLRRKLEERFSFPAVQLEHVQKSSDGTIKSRFELYDGNLVEGVLIPTDKRQTACISSQAGCSLNCKFCATGYLEKKRNLDFDEIFDEACLINKQSLETSGKKLTNIVYMGMGEPLLNYQNVLKSIERITAPDGLAMSPRRITVSTAGIAKMIRKLGDDKVRFNLALSLHAPNDEKRSQVMPINEKNDLKSLVEALNYFYLETKNEITFEYILFRDFNDSIADADELIRLYRQTPVKVINLIEYNPIDQAGFEQPSPEAVTAFMDYLARHRVNARLRKSRGKDIDAACGQLANKA
jgi:23S rRNA (adenine2503-C2)-methyltransferase